MLLVSTPTWMGQHSSVCIWALERLDAEPSQKDLPTATDAVASASATATAAVNAAHLARTVKAAPHPPTAAA
jgi:hypothetical protein